MGASPILRHAPAVHLWQAPEKIAPISFGWEVANGLTLNGADVDNLAEQYAGGNALDFSAGRPLYEAPDYTEQLTNGDFENDTAGVPDDWAAASGATITVESGARTGGSGAQVMQVVTPLGDGGSRAIQTSLVIGVRYSIGAWCKGDGVNGIPRLGDSGTTLVTGTNSALWQYISADFTATSDTLWLNCLGDVATEDTVQFDDVSVVRQYPHEAWANLDGVAEYGTCDAAAAVVSGAATYATILIGVQVLALPGTTAGIFSFGHSATAGYYDLQITSGGIWQVSHRGDATGTLTRTFSTAVDLGQHVVVLTKSSSLNSLYIDGVVDAGSPQGTTSGATTLDRFSVGCIRHAIPVSYANMRFGLCWIFPSALDADQVRAVSKSAAKLCSWI